MRSLTDREVNTARKVMGEKIALLLKLATAKKPAPKRFSAAEALNFAAARCAAKVCRGLANKACELGGTSLYISLQSLCEMDPALKGLRERREKEITEHAKAIAELRSAMYAKMERILSRLIMRRATPQELLEAVDTF